MKPIQVMFAVLAGATVLSVLSCGVDDAPPAEPAASTSALITAPPPGPILGYLPAELPPRLGGRFAIVRAIGSDGRAVGQAESCFIFSGSLSCGVAAVYWDPGQAPVVIPTLSGVGSNIATGITDAGVIVGTGVDSSNHGHGWRWSAATGTVEEIAPDGTALLFSAAASNGWTTGIHFPPGKLGAHAFRHVVGSTVFEDLFPVCVRTLLDSLGLHNMIPPGHPASDCLNDTTDLVATRGAAVDILGNVGGILDIGVGQFRFGYVWLGGGGLVNLQQLNPSLDVHEATAINGTVVGPYTGFDGSTRTYSSAGLPGSGLGDMGVSVSAYPHGLSSRGRLVGTSTTGTQRPLTWYGQTLIYLGVPSGLSAGDAAAVNRCGNIVGNALNSSGRSRALRWTKTGCD